MTTALVASPAEGRPESSDPATLAVTLGPANVSSLRGGIRAGRWTCSVHDLDVVDSVQRARTVLIERCDGSMLAGLRPRAAHESEAAWLSRVFVSVLGELADPPLACALVARVIHRTARVPVSIECWSADAATDVGEPRGWPAWRGEVPLVRTARGVWTLVGPSGSTGIQAEYSALFAALTRCICESDADDTRVRDDVRVELARAVADVDADAFVAAAARYLGGPVSLRDHAAHVVSAVGPGVPGRPQEIELQYDSGVLGTLVLASADPRAAALGLPELASTLLRLRSARTEVEALRNRLTLLSCFTDGASDRTHTDPPRGGRRLVRVAARDGRLGVREIKRLTMAADDNAVLAGLSAVVHGDGLLGVYCDDGATDVTAHRDAWLQLLGEIDRAQRLHVAVSGRAAVPEDARRHRDAIARISRLQRSGGGYFDLPRVAVIDQLGPLSGLLDAVPAAHVVPFVERVLGGLLADGRFGGQLIQTLYAYLQAGGSPRGAGELLHLHGSSVKYRMRVLRELLGERLDNPDKRFDIELALRLYLAGRQLAAELA